MKREDGKQAEPPPELLIGFDCLKFHALPRAGGLRDQPMLLMFRMRTALNTYQNITAYRQAHVSLKEDALNKWYGQNGKLMKFMKYVWKLQGVFDE